MRIKQGHAAMIDDPVQLLFPDIDAFLLHEDKQQEILREGVGQLDISLLRILVGNPERKDGAHTVRLGFKGIGIKCGGVVFDIEMMKQFEIVVHAGAAETTEPILSGSG